MVDSDANRQRAAVTGRTLHLYGDLNADLATKVLAIPEADRFSIRTLDLSDITVIFADGALPIVSDFLRVEKRLRIRCEGNPHISRILKLHGWHDLLESGQGAGDTRIPQRVRTFSAVEHIDTFVTQSVQAVMQRVRCAKDVLKSFEWSLSEITGNVFTHSESNIGALAQMLILPHSQMVRYSVVDSGIGLLASLRPRYRDLKDDIHAIRYAIQKGVTRDTDIGQGWGLYGTSKIASSSGGFLSIWSGNGRMIIHANGHADFYDVPFFHGTAVDFALRTNQALSLRTAIDAVYEPTSIVFNSYERAVGMTSVRLTDHANAFSDRAIGKKLRTVILNILIQPGNEVCVVDFANVRIVASSFADEFLGKMAVDLGLKFESRIRLNNVSDDNRRIISTAIAARRASGLRTPI